MSDPYDPFVDICDLAIWLSLPYRQGGNRPIFPDAEYGAAIGGADPQVAESHKRISRAWDMLFGAAGDTPPGRWVRCSHCGSSYVDHSG